MKRDMNLVRKILEAVEKSPDLLAPPQFSIDGYTEEQIKLHCWLLVQAGFAVGPPPEGGPGAGAPALKCLTWAGYDYLSKLRSGDMG